MKNIVYIKGLNEIPKSCSDCPIEVNIDGTKSHYCAITHQYDFKGNRGKERLSDCPLGQLEF